ncbi:MAG: response regulator transcription factor [Desulfobacca sp.]|nr:response regulator transcription factor [Desulfobacca sp.]
MAKERILVVEDEEDILELVRYNLSREGFRITGVTSGEEGLKTARSMLPDLVLLDLMLPGVDGLEVCRVLKHDAKTQHIPVVILTAKGEEADIVAGLELGAEDYITKPFSPRVLIARVRAVLRRRAIEPPGDTAPLTIHELSIHPGRHEIMVAGQPVELTVTEFRLLHMLARRPGWVFTRTQIINGVHGDDYPVSDRSIDVQIVGLRKKLGPCGNYIETVRGVGYRFKE